MIQGSLQLGVSQGCVTSDDYFTPRSLFDVMGVEFDLDVAAPEGGVPWLPACAHYSQRDDGLSQDWYGFVWCNPPYSNVTPWARRMVDHGSGVLLAPFVKSRWVAPTLAAASLVWVPEFPIHFERPDTLSGSISYLIFAAGFGDQGRDAVSSLEVLGGTLLRAS